MKERQPQPRRRDAAVIVAMLLAGGTLWLTVLGPMGGRTGWVTLLAILTLLAAVRLCDPWIRRFSRWVSGKGKRRTARGADAGAGEE